MSLRALLTVAAAGEMLTGLALLMDLPPVIRLLFGAEIAGAGIAMSRIAGISLLALGASCWPASESAQNASRALVGMLSYSLLVAAYLVVLGIEGRYVGPLLWPAVVAHAVLSALMIRGWLSRIARPDEMRESGASA